MSERAGDLQGVWAEAGRSGGMAGLPCQGRLIDFDGAELTGWIEGGDGALYAFSAADVVGDEDIAIGQAVSFVAAGETALEVRGSEPAHAVARSLRGRLIAYEAADLLGWIEGEDGTLYSFSAADVIGDGEVSIGQPLSFLARGERALEVLAQVVEPSRPLEGSLLGYDEASLCGWIEGDDGQLYAFDAGDVTGDGELRVGQRLAFSTAGVRAAEVRALPAQSAPSGDRQGRLLSYDAAELQGWIEDEAGGLYAFTVGDIETGDEIREGQAVTFRATGERAFEVRAAQAEASAGPDRQGRLLSYDAVELRGWIEDETGGLYVFTAGDIETEDEIREGQGVTFRAAGERALAVRSGEPEAPPKPMTGRLLGYDAYELRGRIAGDDGQDYAFGAADVVDEGELATGQALHFQAAGGRAFDIRGTPVAGRVPPATDAGTRDAAPPLSAGRRWEPNAASFARTPVAAAAPTRASPVPEPPERRAPSPASFLLLRAFPAALLVLGGGAYLFQDELRARFAGSSAAPVATMVPVPSEGTSATETQVAESPPPVAAEPAHATSAEALDVQAPGADELALAGLPVAVETPAPGATPAGPAADAGGVPADDAEASQAVVPTASPTAPVPVSKPLTKPAPKRVAGGAPALEPAGAPPVAWWNGSSGAQQLRLVYAGHLAERPAIVLMFDGRLSGAEAAASHIRVRQGDGRSFTGSWALAGDGRMLVLSAPPGRYEVSIDAGMSDAGGRSLGNARSGPVQVR